MEERKNIFVIIGSASKNSANQKLADIISELSRESFNLTMFDDLKDLPHFDPELSTDNVPQSILEFRRAINAADGVIISTPEYVFSLPSGLKNAIEWCVSTTVFSDKPMGLITASLDGKKAHEQLQLIMKTLTAKFADETVLLISGIKGKINNVGEVTDPKTLEGLRNFIAAYLSLVNNACR
jgi:chromate reductase